MAILSLKNGVSSISGATVKGSFSYFSGGTRALGPSDITGFYSGYDAPNNGYTVYQTYGASGFTATVATNDTELNYILIRMGGTGSTVAQNITWATNTSTVYINSGTTVAPSLDVCVSGAGSTEVNGTYTFAGFETIDGYTRPTYVFNGPGGFTYNIKSRYYGTGNWGLYTSTGEQVSFYIGNTTPPPAFPYQETSWELSDGQAPIPTFSSGAC